MGGSSAGEGHCSGAMGSGRGPASTEDGGKKGGSFPGWPQDGATSAVLLVTELTGVLLSVSCDTSGLSPRHEASPGGGRGREGGEVASAGPRVRGVGDRRDLAHAVRGPLVRGLGARPLKSNSPHPPARKSELSAPSWYVPTCPCRCALGPGLPRPPHVSHRPKHGACPCNEGSDKSCS